jgi:glutamine amidotransferase
MGWNRLENSTETLLKDSGLSTAYFAHGFACRPESVPVVTAWTAHEGDRFPAVVRAGRTVGVQFHPEKSSASGIAFLRAFCEAAAA